MRKGTLRIIIWYPIGLDYEHVVNMYGGSFSRVNGWEQFREEVQKEQRQKVYTLWKFVRTVMKT